MSSNRRHANRSLANGPSSPTRATIPPAFPRDASPTPRGGSGGRKPTKNRLESNAGHHASAYASNPNSAGPARTHQQQQPQGEASALIGTASNGVKRGDSSVNVSAASRKAGGEKGDLDSGQRGSTAGKSSGGEDGGLSTSSTRGVSNSSSSGSTSGGGGGSSGCSKAGKMGDGGVREVRVEAMFFVHMCVFLAIQLLCLHRSALHDINYHVVLLVCLLLLRRIVACFIDFHPPVANKPSPPATFQSVNGSIPSSSFLSRFFLSSTRNESVLARTGSVSGAGSVANGVAASAARSVKEMASSGMKEWRVKGKDGKTGGEGRRGGDKDSAGADAAAAAAAATTTAREPFPLTGSGMMAGNGALKPGSHHPYSFGGSTIGAGGAGGAVDVAGSGGGFDSPEGGNELLLGEDSAGKGNSLLNSGLGEVGRGSGHGQWEQHVFPPIGAVTGTCSSLLLVGLYVAAVALLALKLSLTLPWQSQLLLFVPPICYAIISQTTSSLPPPLSSFPQPPSHAPSLNSLSHSHAAPPSSNPHSSPSLHDCTAPQQNPLAGAALHAAAAAAAPCQQASGVHPLRRWPKLLMRLVLVEACMGSYLVGVVPIQGTYVSLCLHPRIYPQGTYVDVQMHEDILVSRLSCCLLLGYAFVGAAMLLLMKEAVLRREQVEYVAAHLGCWHRVDVPNFTISRDVAEWNPHSVPYSEGAIVQRGGRLFVGLGRFNTAQPGSLSAALLFVTLPPSFPVLSALISPASQFSSCLSPHLHGQPGARVCSCCTTNRLSSPTG
ncbi:unnamed protein product [Closterium sp. NIES-65]|nr:unnamed protein product [Closterium sp. NIES-65]